MRFALLAAIRLYQRHLSPYKGFDCAYRVHVGAASCSALGYRAVRRHGVFAGLKLLRMRTERCAAVHDHFCTRRRAPAPQRGDCDVGCDLPDCSNVLEFVNCCDCGSCDGSKRRDKCTGGRQRKISPSKLKPRSRVHPGGERRTPPAA